MVEAMANSVEDYLIDGLSFKLSPGASYVTDRRSVTWYASGAQTYISNQGARVIRLALNGEGWCDPSTVRLSYTLNNTATAVTGANAANTPILRPIGGPWSLFSRVRCQYQGAICDDISDYNRTHEMLEILTSKPNRENSDVAGFGRRWDDNYYYPTNNITGLDNTPYAGFVGAWANDGTLQKAFGGIMPGGSQSVSFKPLIGILNQNKYLPLMWGGFTMDFEIIGNATDAFIDGNSGSGLHFSTTNTSTTWSIQDIRMTGDVVTLDSALQNSYAEHVLSGKSLPINYGTYITMQQTVTGSNISVNVARAVSRLKTIFCSFNGDYSTDAIRLANFSYYYPKKEFNYFYHPMGLNLINENLGVFYDFTKELEFQVQIGSKMIPEYPIRSISETYSQLKKALGIHSSPWHSISPSYQQYSKDKYIIGIDCERVLDASWTGLNESGPVANN